MSGVMPIIFAGVIMSLPATLDMFIDATKHQRLHAVLSVFIDRELAVIASVCIADCSVQLLLYSRFSLMPYRWREASQAGWHDSRYSSGTPTTDMLNKALHRMALTGSFYLAAIALTPMVFSAMSGVRISFGGTSLMILTGVALEVVRSIEGYMTVRHHKGFLG